MVLVKTKYSLKLVLSQQCSIAPLTMAMCGMNAK